MSDSIPIRWPDRAEWAKGRRTFHLDVADIDVSRAARDYGTPEEVAAAIGEVEAAIREARRLLTQTRREAGSLWQQPGETDEAYLRRYRTMSEAEQGRTFEPIDRQARRALRLALADLRQGELPIAFPRGFHDAAPQPCCPTLERLLAKRAEARHAAVEAARREKEAAPIDDAAWDDELKRRALVEAYRAADEKRGYRHIF